ncbi:FKBP-type 22 kDa peptidyl-prolyl cis-trans isomerase [Candidatus Magnetaquicoccaceae bacterium FCR-1]|uniref:Peptidyl-prolyl cis-trans isomerase n=1 Tax=Candidatus Magnetaquiglobus chichijimensis TaxID=3141448 RepID=A0ABQ0C5T1_9PROT
MKPVSLLAAAALLLVGLTAAPIGAQEKSGADASGFKNSKERYSYAVGLQIGEQVKQITSSMDMSAFMAGMKDTLDGKPPKLTPEQVEQAKNEFRDIVRKEMEQKQQSAASRNAKQGSDYLATNAKKKGVTTTASGLQYEVLKEASGPKPKATDQVKVHYHGTLLDGTVFDSSVARKEPVTFPLNRVIPGWTEGVQLMPVGSKFRFVIPSKLAYGSNGAPPKIEPESTLIFEVELLEIVGEKK